MKNYLIIHKGTIYNREYSNGNPIPLSSSETEEMIQNYGLANDGLEDLLVIEFKEARVTREVISTVEVDPKPPRKRKKK